VATNAGPRWLILTQYYAPEIGAPQIRLRAIAKELRRRGIRVEVLTGMPNYPAGVIHPAYAGRWWMTEEIDKVAVRRVWTYAGTGKSPTRRLANYFSYTFASLGPALFGPRPDVLFVESQPLSLGLNALLMKWLRGVPYIYNVPDLQIDVARQLGFMKNETVLRVATWLENLFLKHSWKVSTVTRRFIAHFEDRGIPANQITFLPNGADTDFLRPAAAAPELLDRWQLHGKTVFLYVGTHAYYHGLDTLIDAATRLQHRHDLAFLLVGDGPERRRLKQVAQDRGLSNVIFGDSPYEEMTRLYSIAYASVATLRRISVATDMRLSKIFPSLSCGVPVIYAGEGEAASLLAAEGCGVVVNPENPEDLAAAVSDLAADPARRNRMGVNGRHFVEQEYSWSTIVGNWLNELGHVSDEPPRTIVAASPVVLERRRDTRQF
jgi:colanic acid biosynthesis glycosyl transferase WcaI